MSSEKCEDAAERAHVFKDTTIHGNAHLGNTYITQAEPSRSAVDTCRNALFLTDPIVDRETLKTEKGQRASGTCEWIRDSAAFKSWLVGDTHRLWISGGPGKGKTMLSVFLTEELERHTQETPNSVLLFYFCTHQNEKRNNASAILRSLIYQLLTRNRSLYSLISSYFEDEKKTEATLILLDALWLVLETLLRAPEVGAVLCVLDGLDECDDVSQRFIASKFSEFSNSGGTESYKRKLTPIVISRPIPGLDTFTQIKLDPDNDDYVDHDIRQFISSRLRNLQIPGFDEDLRGKVKDALLRGACGTFLWVGFVMRELSTKTTCTELMETLETLPAGLPGMYSRMLRQTDPSRRPIVSDILRWVTLALEPLRLKDMALAVGLQSTGGLDINQTTLDYINICGPIIRITGEHVSLVHQSARDYLLRQEVEGDPVLECFRIEEQKAHAALTLTCLDSLETRLLIKYERNREQARAIRDAPLLLYAVSHWMAHAASSGEHLDWNVLLKRPFFEDKSTSRRDWGVARQVLDRRPIDLDYLPTPVFNISCKAGISALSRQLVLGGKFPVTSPIDVPRRTRAHDAALLCALHYGRREIVRLLLEHGANVNKKGGPEGESPLMTAISAKDTSTVLLLLGHGADVQATNKKKETPLLLAIWKRDTAMIRSLLSRGAKTNVINIYYNTPLTLAISEDDEEVVELLLDHGAKVDMEDPKGGTPLNHAVSFSKTAIIQLLLDRGARINAKNCEGDTPLMSTISEFGCERTMRFLLDRGAKVNIKNKKGITPLMAAINQDSPAIVQLLLERGAEFDPNHALYRPLKGTRADRVVPILRLLLRYGAHVNGWYDGEAPMHAAVYRGMADAVKLLLDHGAKVNAKNKHGVTPLCKAIFDNCRSKKDVVLTLLQHGADVNAKLVGCRRSVLTGAVLNGDLEAARLLLRHGAEVNAKDGNGMTALSHARHRGYEEMERLLIDHGADIPAEIVLCADALGIVEEKPSTWKRLTTALSK